MADKTPPAPPPPPLDPNVKIFADAIGEAIRANREPSPLAKAGFTPAQEARFAAPAKPLRWRRVACKSEDTGATFTLYVTESRTHPAGRITAMEGYTYPSGITVYKENGGLVPDGTSILRAGTGAPAPGVELAKHDCTPEYLQWRWTEFYQLDWRRLSGKPLLERMAIDDAAFTTPWQDGRVFADGEAALP